MWFEELQDGRYGGHLGYWNRTILAILNFRNTLIPLIMNKRNQTYRSGVDVIWRFSRWLPWRPSWISEQNALAILNLHAAPMPSTMFLLLLTYGSGADNNWSTHYGLGGDVVWEFHYGQHGSYLGCRNETNLGVLNLHISPMPTTKFQLNLT